MEADWQDDEVDPIVSELWTKLEGIRSRRSARRSNVGRPLGRGLKIQIGVVLIAVTMGLASAVLLFSHSFSYTAPSAKLSTVCSALTATTSGSTIVFACSSNPAMSV